MKQSLHRNASTFTKERHATNAGSAHTKHRGRMGTWHNPLSLSRINPDRILDDTTILRANDLHLLGGSSRNQRTDKLRSLSGDLHLTYVSAERRTITAIVACDQHASGQRDWLPDVPAYSEQLGADGRLAGIDGPQPAAATEHLELGRAYGVHVRFQTVLVEVERTTMAEYECRIGNRTVECSINLQGYERLVYLADCILDAMREINLLDVIDDN